MWIKKTLLGMCLFWWEIVAGCCRFFQGFFVGREVWIPNISKHVSPNKRKSKLKTWQANTDLQMSHGKNGAFTDFMRDRARYEFMGWPYPIRCHSKTLKQLPFPKCHFCRHRSTKMFGSPGGNTQTWNQQGSWWSTNPKRNAFQNSPQEYPFNLQSSFRPAKDG